MIIMKRNCTSSIPPSNASPIASISQLCLNIFVEATLINEANFPEAYRDLFMEQG